MKQRCAEQVVVVVLAAMAGACSTPSISASSTSSPPAGNLETFVSKVAGEVRDATESALVELGVRDAGNRAAAPPAPAPAAVPTRAPRRNRAAAAAPPKPDPEAPAVSSMPASVEAPAVAESVAIEPPLATGPSIVYSEADIDVAPPRLKFTDLPRWLPPGGPESDTVEVVVSAHGGVERIKLMSEPRQLIAMMTLSAAKMWKFDPALKDGEPVRYRLVLKTPSTSYQ